MNLPKIALLSNGLRKCKSCNQAKPIWEYKYKETDSMNCSSCYHKYIKDKPRKSDADFHFILIGDGDWYAPYFN